jgi:tRNA A37 threonylcarbamoyladenosine synthetase subunit TsaC/SUA5/YrdC
MARLVNSLLPDASGEQPSTVLDVTSSAVRILREGAIKKEAIFDTIEASRTP